jgi:hypothetical protein
MLVHAPRAIGLNADGMAGTLHSAYFLERAALWSVAPRNPRRLVCDASGAARIGRTMSPKCVTPGSPEGHNGRTVLRRKAEVHFFIFKSLPLKVLTIAAMSPSWVS